MDCFIVCKKNLIKGWNYEKENTKDGIKYERVLRELEQQKTNDYDPPKNPSYMEDGKG